MNLLPGLFAFPEVDQLLNEHVAQFLLDLWGRIVFERTVRVASRHSDSSNIALSKRISATPVLKVAGIAARCFTQCASKSTCLPDS